MASPHASPLRDSPPTYDDCVTEVELYRQKAALLRKLKKIFQSLSARSQVKALKTIYKDVDQSTANITKISPPPPPPPTYDDCVKEVNRLIQKAATDTEFQQKIKAAFLKTTGSQENLKAIHEGVDQFTENITKINIAFDDIRAKLYAVDRRGLKNRKGEIWKGGPRWVHLRDKWRSLLKESQDIARKSVTRCDEFMLFCEGILETTSVDDQLYKDTITELEKCIKEPDPAGGHYNPEDLEKQATTQSPGLCHLKDRLAGFRSDFDDFFRYQTQIDPDIEDLNKKIQVIEREITFDVSMIMSLGVVLRSTVSTTLTGGVIAAALGPLSMGQIIVLIIGSLVAIGEAGALAYFASNDCCSKGEQRDKWQGELRGKEALEDALVAVMCKLGNQTDGLDFILSQIDLLKNVWHTISNEAHLIAGRLTAATDKETLTYLQADIEAAKETYKELRMSLAKYGSAI